MILIKSITGRLFIKITNLYFFLQLIIILVIVMNIMPWRKYNKKDGKYGPIYFISRGIQVRYDSRGLWVVFMEKNGVRKNKTFGQGRDALVKAIKGAEKLSSKMTALPVQQEAEAAKQKAESGIPKFKPYSIIWLENNEGRWHVNTLQRYQEILRLHIWTDNVFAAKRLDEIERSDIKRLLQRLFKIRSSATVETAHSVIHGIFEEAIDDNIVHGNPAKGLLKKILPPKNRRNEKEADPLSLEERDLFLDYAEQHCTLSEQLILKVMSYAGFRLGEVLAMRIRHIDFNNMTYHVCESFKKNKFSKPKGAKKRLVDIPEFLMEVFKSYILHIRKDNMQKGKCGEVDLLFLDPKENLKWPFSQRRIQDLVKKVCKGTGLRFRNPHDLRHTYATILLMAHQSPAYVQKQMGHSSISITVDTYGHWVSGEGRSGLEDALLGSVRNPGGNRISSHIKQNDLSK